jgi:proteinaceous RNase P
VPVEEKSGDERVRTWLCIDRTDLTKQTSQTPAANGVAKVEASNGAGQRQLKDQAVTGKRKDRD